jgi:hypothetical protein
MFHMLTLMKPPCVAGKTQTVASYITKTQDLHECVH